MTFYLVFEDFGLFGNEARCDPDKDGDYKRIVADIAHGQYCCPYKVLAIDEAVGSTVNVTHQVALDVYSLCEREQIEPTDELTDFLEQELGVFAAEPLRVA